MKLGWIEISFIWHGPGSESINKRKLDAKLREIYAKRGPEGGLVAAIRYHRSITKAALTDSKLYCEKVCNHVPSHMGRW